MPGEGLRRRKQEDLLPKKLVAGQKRKVGIYSSEI